MRIIKKGNFIKDLSAFTETNQNDIIKKIHKSRRKSFEKDI